MTGRFKTLLAAVLATALSAGFATPAQAQPEPGSISSSQAPSTGLESPDTPMKGRKIPTVGAIIDAYGNPITGEEKDTAPRRRLPAGAYGGYGKQPERPLPDPSDDTPVW